MFKWFRNKINSLRRSDVTFLVIRSCEDPHTNYIELPDGLRLIIRDGKYDGHYVA